MYFVEMKITKSFIELFIFFLHGRSQISLSNAAFTNEMSNNKNQYEDNRVMAYSH